MCGAATFPDTVNVPVLALVPVPFAQADRLDNHFSLYVSYTQSRQHIGTLGSKIFIRRLIRFKAAINTDSHGLDLNKITNKNNEFRSFKTH